MNSTGGIEHRQRRVSHSVLLIFMGGGKEGESVEGEAKLFFC